ncbi:MAG TPA: protein-glutamate O-methyltransferase [Caulobacteraceae bacterium]|jgi:chemotaxis protein methyltransferase CheR
MVDGEFLLTEKDFRQIAAMLHGDAGIALPESKATLVYSRLAKRLRALGLTSFRDYCELVAGERGLDERQKMLAALTTNVTRFFREPHHFDHLRTTVLPPLLDAARDGARVRLWSAACSTGQEPYSAAMTLLELAPEAGRYDIRILATDIDPNVVAEGRRGEYTDDTVAPVPQELRRRWMDRTGDGWRMGEAARGLVTFLELNLIGEWPMRGRFDAIFCRNVVIYFEDDTQSRIWSRLTAQLAPAGHLYIGHSERVIGPAADALRLVGTTTYRGEERR